jgi:hypothetical protein
LAVNTAGWLRGRQVSAGGTGIVSQAGVALLRALAHKTELTAGLYLLDDGDLRAVLAWVRRVARLRP